MAKIIKTGPDCFFINADSSISMKYDLYLNEYFKMGETKIPADKIYIQEGGQIVFKSEDGEKIIIDDGYRTALIVAGYIDFDNKEEFEALKNKTFSYNKAGYVFSGYINSINDMISRNVARKKKQLPLYPSKRDKDKSMSLYFRVYATRGDSLESTMKSKHQLHEIGSRILQDYVAGCVSATIDECEVEKTILKYEDDL